MRDQYSAGLYRTKLLEVLRKFRNNESKERDFLIGCLEKHGYILKRNLKEDDYIETDYQEYTNYDPFDTYQETYEYSDTNTYNQRFQRTFIEGNNKLTEMQKRGISNQETEFTKVSEDIDNALNAISQVYRIDIDRIKQNALDMYLQIMNYYATGNNVRDEIEANTKGIKKGYKALVVGYALSNNQIYINDEILIRFFREGVALQDLVKPRRYLKKILFKNTSAPSQPVSTGNCNFILSKLPPKAQKQVAKIIQWFGPEYTTAAIYYICNVTIDKGGVTPIKIKWGAQAITQKLLEENCKPPSSSVISSRSKEITNYYNARYEQKEELLNLPS
jgi:hypothetical protein